MNFYSFYIFIDSLNRVNYLKKQKLYFQNKYYHLYFINEYSIITFILLIFVIITQSIKVLLPYIFQKDDIIIDLFVINLSFVDSSMTSL